MVAGVKVQIRGLAELDRALSGIGRAVSKRMLTNALKSAGEPMRDLMKALAPDDPATGPPYDLKSSIIVSTLSTPIGKSQLPAKYSSAVFVGAAAPYGYPQAEFTEWGTRKMPAHPWGRPAFDNQKNHVVNILGEELWAAIDRYARRHGRSAIGR